MGAGYTATSVKVSKAQTVLPAETVTDEQQILDEAIVVDAMQEPVDV